PNPEAIRIDLGERHAARLPQRRHGDAAARVSHPQRHRVGEARTASESRVPMLHALDRDSPVGDEEQEGQQGATHIQLRGDEGGKRREADEERVAIPHAGFRREASRQTSHPETRRADHPLPARHDRSRRRCLRSVRGIRVNRCCRNQVGAPLHRLRTGQRLRAACRRPPVGRGRVPFRPKLIPTSPYRNSKTVDVYRRITGPGQFADAARGLIELLQPSEGARVLDVGTGTGIVAERAIQRVGISGLIIGVDASIEMLRAARQALRYPVVAGALPSLPFRDQTFDVAAAGFVISHVADYKLALRDIARVCRDGGRIGVTAWGSLPNPAGQLWTEVACRFVPRDDLDSAFQAHIPWDASFSEPARLRNALEDAGLASVSIDTRIYRCRMSTADFLLSREASIQGSILDERLTVERRR